MGMLVLNCFLFYNYLIFMHMNGRLLDIYMRLTGTEEGFLPGDNELSLKHMKWIYYKAK